MNNNGTLDPAILNFLQARYTFYITYIPFGSLAVLTNALLIIFLVLDFGILKNSPMIFGLAWANLANGMHAFVYGIYRVPLLLSDAIDEPASSMWCMSTLMPTCVLLGYALPATVQCLIGLERFLAITAFNWYRLHWSSRRSWYALCMAYILTICIWVVPAWFKAFSNVHVVTRECSSSSVLGADLMYSLMQCDSGVSVIGLLLSLTSILVGRRRFGAMKPATASADAAATAVHLKKQMRLTKMMFIIALVDAFFVVAPNVLMLMYTTGFTFLPYTTGLYATIAYCCNSVSSVVVYVTMNKELRTSVLVKCRRWVSMAMCQKKPEDKGATTECNTRKGYATNGQSRTAW